MNLILLLLFIMSVITPTASSDSNSLKKMSEIMQVKKLSEFAIIPTRGSKYAAGTCNYCVTMIVTSVFNNHQIIIMMIGPLISSSLSIY